MENNMLTADDAELVYGRELISSMILVGESGGQSMVYAVDASDIVFGLIEVTTEHGPLYLDPDEQYPVLF
jgi:hypothetical protein